MMVIERNRAWILILTLAAGCQQKPTLLETPTNNWLPHPRGPELQIMDGQSLRLVEGMSGEEYSCLDDNGVRQTKTAFSDVSYGISDGRVFFEANLGCPIKIRRVSRVIKPESVVKINEALNRLKPRKVTNDGPCVQKGYYAGIDIAAPPVMEENRTYVRSFFVHVAPKSLTFCRERFEVDADFEQLKGLFAEAFNNAALPP